MYGARRWIKYWPKSPNVKKRWTHYNRWNGPRPGGKKSTAWSRPAKKDPRVRDAVDPPVRFRLVVHGLDDEPSAPDATALVRERKRGGG